MPSLCDFLPIEETDTMPRLRQRVATIFVDHQEWLGLRLNYAKAQTSGSLGGISATLLEILQPRFELQRTSKVKRTICVIYPVFSNKKKKIL